MDICKDVFVIAVILLSVCSSTDGIGCPEPVVEDAQIEFSNSPGEDGLYPRDTMISVECSMGAAMQGNRFVICLETETWDTLPTCTRTTGNIRCKLPRAPWNGKIKRIGARQAIVGCNRGFTLHGHRRIMCAVTASGEQQWPLTVCQGPYHCNNPGNLPGADWTLVSADRRSNNESSQFSPNTKISITCRPGLGMVGKPKVKCGMDGIWYPTIPTCEVIECPPLTENIPHGHSDMMNRTYQHGEAVEYFCDPGYRIFGRSTRVCSVDSAGGRWSHLNPVCEEILCPHPGDIQFGDISLESLRVGGSVTFYCRSGYQIRGSAVRRCLPSGKWSGELTTCDHESFYCPNPGIPLGGYMENQETASFQKRGVVRYACHSSRTLMGSAELYCNTSRRWSAKTPTCQGRFDFDDINEVAKKLHFVADSIAIETHDTSTSPKGRTIDLSSERGYEIYFIFDASGSIATDQFQKALNFAKALVRKIGVDGARYATCVYASNPDCTLFIHDYQETVEYVEIQIDALVEFQKNSEIGKGTATGKALQLIHEDVIPLSEAQSPSPGGVNRVIFLFSDGHTNMGASAATSKEHAQILREDHHVQIHCIGVTSNVDRSELQDIASKPLEEHLFLFEHYKDLDLLVEIITRTKTDYSRCGFNGDPVIPKSSKGRISGGEDAKLYEWPWQVALYCQTGRQLKFFCGGTLIAQNLVLTAAHCLKCFNRICPDICDWSGIRVYTGVNDRRTIDGPGTSVYEVDGEDAVIVHESFASSLVNDIALLRLRGFSELSLKVRTICMPQEDMTDDVLYALDGGPSYVTGWGVTTPYDIPPEDECKDNFRVVNNMHNRLQQLELPLVSNAICIESLPEKNSAYRCTTELDFSPTETFCAGYREGGWDACKGDSGGPVMRELMMSDGSKRWVQIGIVSWGEGCAQEGRYGFYTRLSRYIGWIQQHVGNSILI